MADPLTFFFLFALGVQAGFGLYWIADGRITARRRAEMLRRSYDRDRALGEMWASLRQNGDLLDDALPPDVRLPD
jgi:hypothetical protein